MRVVKDYARALVVVACLLAFAALLSSSKPFNGIASAQAESARSREDAYRANNLGVALLEQFKPKEAAEQFRRALSIDSRLTLPRINLTFRRIEAGVR